MLLELKRLRRLHVGPLDLAVEAGHCISISGRSGGGKSVILRSIADLDPHEGEVFLEGRACSSMPATQWRRQVTYVAAESGWWEDTVRPHFPPSTDFAAILPPLGLDASVADRSINGLSTGERQRLALLRALCLQSKVLLLDEPTSALDHESVLQVEEVLKERLAQGTAILLVTHDVEQARRLASRHLHLDAGQLEEISADALVHPDEVPELVK